MLKEITFQISYVENHASANLVVRNAALSDKRPDHEDRDAEHGRRFLHGQPPPSQSSSDL